MTDEVKTSMGMTFKAFLTPNFAKLLIPGAPEQDGPVVAIRDLSPTALDALAAQWLDHLYAGVERASPFKLTGA